MKKDVHVYIDYEIANKIEKSAKKRNKRISDEYCELLKQALSFNELENNFNKFQEDLVWLCKKTQYISKQIEALYSILKIDMAEEKDPLGN